ncbi:MAG: RnfABCDGE type electron transport complex subunit D [Clostridiales bacterium]|nr:RnfABCDGE type electron transport complex subunit D [Clostridiales bacterium]
MAKYVYSSSPHVKSPATTRRIMIDVCIALLPACIAGCVLMGVANPAYSKLGWLSFMQLLICCVSSVAAEFVYLLCCKKSFMTILKEFDFTSLVTGLLIGMNLYPTTKWYVGILASVFAIVVVKMLFGGTGKNIVNPAIAGRIFAFIAFGAAFGGSMAFVNPANGNAVQIVSPVSGGKVTAGATPLQTLFNADYTSTLTNLDLFLGTGVAGCIGEVCKLALIAGGIYLVVRGVLNFRWPLVYIAATGIVAVLIVWIESCFNTSGQFVPALMGTKFVPALKAFLPSILSGGLILGAIFMATDYVTTPNTKLGNYIYFALLGILTAVLRKAVKGEAVSFAILLMNLLVPLFDMYIRRKPFGYVKPVKEKKVKKSEQKEGV